jgi:hypothetical protein
MNIPKKDAQLHTFEGGTDTDTAPELMPPNRARYMLNVRTYSFGQRGVVTNIAGNVLVSTPLPAGTNTAIGWGADEEHGQFYFIVCNSTGFHTVFMYDNKKNSIVVLLQSRTDSNDVDILTLSTDYLINHVDVIPSINGPLITWCDGLNNAVKFNRNKALDKSDTGYGLIIERDFINAYKKSPIFAPTCSYFTDYTRTSNFLYGKLFKFAIRFIYDDGEVSNWSDWSLVALPPNQSYSGVNTITYDNNGIALQLETGNQLVIKIEVAFKVGSQDFVTTTILDKSQLSIESNSTYAYNFYNDGADDATDQGKINRQFSVLPDKPFCQAFTKNAMTYSKFFEGFDGVKMNMAVAVTYEDLFLPDGTVNQFNSPSFISTLITNGYSSGSLGVNKRWNVQEHFQIGFDVKTGNKYQLFGKNGKSANFSFSYTANAEDDAISVANKFKSLLRTNVARGVPDGPNGISNENIDGDGNVSWDYTILGYWNESPVVWSSTVSPVSFQTLQDDGSSVNMVKPGSNRKYAVGYEDGDGRKGLANTSDAAVANTGFITEVGDQKRAIHQISIFNPPPLWAKYYYLLRTPDSGPWIQMLIQKVIDVDPDPHSVAAGNSQKYLDLVVGSLFTYQKLHPNTVVKYDFAKGDRLRFIKYYDQANNNAKVLYSYIEVEVLSYNINTQEVVNENIQLNGTDVVTINGVANVSYVGKTLIVNGYERTIIGAPAGNKYQLNSPVADGTLTAVIKFASFIISDQRGILRIKQPDNVVIKDLSLVEVYKPQLNDSVDGYKQFQPFGVKLEIGNWGTPQAFHMGTVQNQYQTGPNDPAIIKVTHGDAYARNRELPTNNSVPGTQLLVDHIIDPNYSDFYESDMSALGKVFPQDDGSGRKYFGSRVRFSNNFIEDTRVNGLSDFDNGDREDYNDPYGDIMLMRFRENRLYIFKPLKTGWIPILQSILEDNTGQKVIGISAKLLNQMQYFSWEGGIGNNPESWCSNGNYQYFASTNSGAFMRLAGDGCDPISKLYNFDTDVRQALSIAEKFGLQIFGGIDKEKSEVLFHIPAYHNYIFRGGFSEPQWNAYNDAVPEGTTFEITQQPAHGSVSIDDDGQFDLQVGSVLGPDFFIYRARLSDGSFLPARKECFNVVKPRTNSNGFQVQDASKYCVKVNVGFFPDFDSAYCVTENNGFRVRTSSKYCQRNVTGFFPDLDSAYCLSTPQIDMADFDFMVMRWTWASGSGVDLDTITGLIGTGTAYEGDLSTRKGWVGYNQNPDPSTGAVGSGSRTIPYGSGTPYLNWGTDSVGASGVEAILFDLKKFKTDNPSTPNPISVKMNAYWYTSKGSGIVTLEIKTYKGGTMALDALNRNFVNTGGTLKTNFSQEVIVDVQSMATLIANSRDVAQMDYDKTTNTAILTIN